MEIINPGEKIEVTESTKQYRPGSTGYLAFQRSGEHFNLWDTWIVFTKFGKKGKDRVEPIELNVEVVNIDKATKINARELVKALAIKHGSIPRLADYKANAEIRKISMKSKNVIDLELWDFLGYISSLSMFMSWLTYGYGGHRQRLLHYEGQNEVVIPNIEPEMLGYYICWAVGKSARAAVREASLYHFRDPDNRASLMHRLYRSLSLLQRGVYKYSGNIKAAHHDTQQKMAEVADHHIRHKGKPPVAMPEIKVRLGNIDIVARPNHRRQI